MLLSNRQPLPFETQALPETQAQDLKGLGVSRPKRPTEATLQSLASVQTPASPFNKTLTAAHTHFTGS